MSAVNALISAAVDGLLSPFEAWPASAGLAIVSLATAVVMLAVIRLTSNHAKLAAVKRSLQACVYEVRLFNDDLRAMLRAVGEMLRHNLTFLRLSLAPVLWMAVPLILLFAQLEFRYGYAGLDEGQTALVKVRMHSARGPAPILEAPPGIRIETPAVWMPAIRDAAWRIAVEHRGDYELIVRSGGAVLTKSVRVTNRVVRRSPVRTDSGLVNQLLYPVEQPLPGDVDVESIAVTYPRRGVNVLGWEMHWIAAFFVLSMVFMLALKRWFRVVAE